ncbi:GNAT family N-acetyltransferase [Streptomyces sp. Go40/10]|uniref:bifunctional acetate--CoA ligase family protein/GNAT family N-acetyltransferase n=1 Tax=Streptomyces sp. Go40/10 TaxID=2825844 RepID=UPI001E632F1B|nr:GNAT family N-acetyltransferase [Streptomyces sp. Go40/10]UFR06268.1 GNAT family N-acetyltransferase [Streptomyces sp. Go40/10]
MPDTRPAPAPAQPVPVHVRQTPVHAEQTPVHPRRTPVHAEQTPPQTPADVQQAPAPARHAPVHALLADGTTVRIRRAGPEDHDAVLALYEAMSPDNLRLRFFSLSRVSVRRAAHRATAPGRPGHRTLLAEHAGRLVGLAEYDGPPGGTTADAALAVADDWHHRGVATLLLEHLADAARTAGITAFTADALAENREVLKVFHDLGLRVTRHYDGPEVHCVVELTEDEDYLRAVEARAGRAGVASLRPLLRPRSVVVIGAGRGPGSAGRAVLRAVRRGGFTGRLFAVHPEAHALCGVPAHPSVAALPVVPDLAVIAVPAAAVPGAAEECGRAGVRALLVVSDGLDARLSNALMEVCRGHGMRLLGPHSLGLATTDDGIRLNATLTTGCPGPGTAGVAVQSGGVGIALLDGLARLGIGLSEFVSLGDKYDVSGNDLLQWWEADGRTGLAVLHLESFGNPRAFSRTARRVARAMPVLTVDAGRSEPGRAVTRQALFAQAGITATRTVAELLDTAALLHAQPLPHGTRVAVVSNARGLGVLAADACADAGLSVPPLDASLAAELRDLLPAGAAAGNPVDVTAAVGEERLLACVERLARHDGVDAVLVTLVPTAVAAATGDDPLRALTELPFPLPRPVVAVLPAQAARVELRRSRGGTPLPVHSDAADAARALAHAARRAAWLSQRPDTSPEPVEADTGRARRLVAAWLEEHPSGGRLDPRDTAALLACYGIPQPPWAWARDEDEAVRAVERLAGADGRVVLRAYVPGPPPRDERGAVPLDVHGAARVRAAHRDLVTRFGDLLAGVVVQPPADRGTELFAGVVQDEVFGPLVVYGPGGAAADPLAGHAVRLAPLTGRDAHDLVTAPGLPAAPAAHTARLEQLLHRLSRLACDLPHVTEAALDPLLAGPHGVHALNARIHLTPHRPNDPYLRRLR